MNLALVVSAGKANHPESGRECLRITTDKEWSPFNAPMTDVWCDPSAPQPKSGDVISWDHHSVWLCAVRYRKLELDSNTTAPLH